MRRALRFALFVVLSSQPLVAQDEFASSSRGAMNALAECRHAMANASGAPWTIDDQARICDEQFDSSSPPAGSVSANCWDDLNAARVELRVAADLYARGRRARSPEQGRLVREAQQHHRLADDAITRADACILVAWDGFNSNGRGGRQPDRGRTPPPPPPSPGGDRGRPPTDIRVRDVFADILRCWRQAMPGFTAPPIVQATSGLVLAQYDRKTGVLTVNQEKLDYECTTRSRYNLPRNTVGAAPGALTGGATTACMALYLAHEIGHHVQALQDRSSEGKAAELEADQLAGQALACLAGRGRFTPADAMRAMQVVAAFGGDDPAFPGDPHGSAAERYARMKSGFGGLP